MNKLKNRSIFILLTIILSLGITLGAVYYMYQYKDSRENKLKTSMISINFTEKSNVINLTSNVPMIDDLGLKGTPYEFTITNTSTVPIKTNIKLDVDNDTTIKYGAVRYALFINDEMLKKDYIHSDDLTLYTTNELKPNETINCKIKFWVDYYYDYPGETFKAKIKAEGESVDELQQEAITVTFDADGGILDTTSKEVYYHGYYGELPTPTKEGYTFMGWNGKNMFDIDSVLSSSLIKNVNNTYTMIKNNSNDRYSKFYSIQIPANIPFNISYILLEYNSNYLPLQFIAKCNDNSSYNLYNGTTNSGGMWTFDKTITSIQIYQEGSRPDGTYAKFKNFQLEEGTVATEYEPYYIRSDTKVVQNENHTLKAIWKENS